MVKSNRHQKEEYMKYTIQDGIIEIAPNEAMRRKTVADFLDEYRQSKKNRYLLVQDGMILLDGVPVKDIQQEIGMRTLAILRKDSGPDWIQSETPCEVIYEDAFVYIVHKEAGVIIHGEPDDTECLNAMAAAWLADHDLHVPVRPLHRLDKDTRGLVMYSRIPFFQPWLDAMMKEKQIRRHYLAICYGKAEPGTKFTCNEAIGADRHRNGAYRVSKTGVPASTKAEVLARKGKYLLIGCQLETGRTHQIRVHLANKGFPIVNDPLYGKVSADFEHMGLWADEIEFRSPLTRKKHRIRDRMLKEYEIFGLEK